MRQEAIFAIEARDGSAAARTDGGDAFFVSIRGCGVRVRARVTDMRDGSYTVRYKPEVSGSYFISISLCAPARCANPAGHAAACSAIIRVALSAQTASRYQAAPSSATRERPRHVHCSASCVARPYRWPSLACSSTLR